MISIFLRCHFFHDYFLSPPLFHITPCQLHMLCVIIEALSPLPPHAQSRHMPPRYLFFMATAAIIDTLDITMAAAFSPCYIYDAAVVTPPLLRYSLPLFATMALICFLLISARATHCFACCYYVFFQLIFDYAFATLMPLFTLIAFRFSCVDFSLPIAAISFAYKSCDYFRHIIDITLDADISILLITPLSLSDYHFDAYYY